MNVTSITARVPKARPEPTPADLLRELIAARAPSTAELRRRLHQQRDTGSAADDQAAVAPSSA